MNKFVRLLAIVLLPVVMGACADTPRERYAQVNDSFIAATSTLVEGRQAGAFDAQQWGEDILPLLEAGNSLVNDYDEATQNGEAPGIAQQIQGILTALQPYIIQALAEEENDE